MLLLLLGNSEHRRRSLFGGDCAKICNLKKAQHGVPFIKVNRCSVIEKDKIILTKSLRYWE